MSYFRLDFNLTPDLTPDVETKNRSKTQMNKKINLPCLGIIALGAILNSSGAMAQVDFIKADNTTVLNADGSYTTPGVPTTADTIVFDGTVTTNSQIPVGAGGISVNGLRIESSLTALPIITTTGGSGLTLGSGGITKQDGTALFRISAPLTLSDSQTWDVGSGTGSLRLSGQFNSGGNALLVQGAGILELQATNTFDSSVTITNAQVSISSATANVTLGGANTFDTLSITNGRVSGSTIGDYGVSSNFGDGGTNTVITLGGTSTTGAVEYSGTTAASNRDFRRNANNSGNAGNINGIIEVTSVGETLTLSGNLISASSSVNGGWSLGGNGNLTIQSDINNQANGGLTSLDKFGNGVLTLSGTNSIEGGTTVSAGTLLVNGSLTASSSVNVSSGATLGGSGTITGAVVIDGTLSPGSSPGLLSTGDLMLNSGADSFFQINGLTRGIQFDAVDVTGLLTLGGTLTIDFGFTPQVTDTFDLFDFTSQMGDFSSVVFVDPGFGGTFDASTGVLSLSAVPEPGSFAMLIGGLGVLALLRRRSKTA